MSQDKLFQDKKTAPVTCLGMTFDSDQARREYFTSKLAEKLKDPAFRKIEGFPIARDEDILALSDPPYYTACPNPWIGDFVREWQKEKAELAAKSGVDPDAAYDRKPFAADVSEGKNDPIYNAHSYHTKVPHKAIMRYILHYTDPGDIVFDGFCGTGMTGVAAQLCGDRATVESLGYRVQEDGTIMQEEFDENGKPVWRPFSQLGARKAILNDLSPVASFIAYNYNTPVDVIEFQAEATRILKEVDAECGWMYETTDPESKAKGKINYTVWSDVFVCPDCTREVIFWNAAVDKKAGKVHDEFPCPNCGSRLTKRRMDRAWVTKYDKAINQNVRQAKQVAVFINYSIGKKRYEKRLDANDLEVIDRIENGVIPYWFPTNVIPHGYNTAQPKNSHGVSHIHHFYTKRNLWVLAAFWDRLPKKMRWLATSFMSRNLTKCNRFIINHHNPNGRINGPLTGTLYVPSEQVEQSCIELFKEKILSVGWNHGRNLVSNQSSSQHLTEQGEHADYIFVDPPFGGNYMYSELNFIWEAWLKILTDNTHEAIENPTQFKGLNEYRGLLLRSFKHHATFLKPRRWITVEFNNSKNSVWNAIQDALQNAGFVIADVRVLDKTHGGIKAAALANVVKKDLIISAYKPDEGLEERFRLEAGTEQGVWDFVREHLRQLPVVVTQPGGKRIEVVAERQHYLLFDRMVAFHVQRGVSVPISAAEFYAGLSQRFSERDGMWFLPEQVVEYDRKRLANPSIIQPDMFVMDEATAIQWLRQRLTNKPMTFQEIHPMFMKEIGGWQKREKALELMELLEQNFIRYDGNGAIPAQIVSWLKCSEKHRELIKQSGNGDLETADMTLIGAARDRWYVPNPNRQVDLEKVREKALLKEFEEYKKMAAASGGKKGSGARLKVFRLEAIRAGFRKAHQEKDFETILSVGARLPDSVIQEDDKLVMWYTMALTRAGG